MSRCCVFLFAFLACAATLACTTAPEDVFCEENSECGDDTMYCLHEGAGDGICVDCSDEGCGDPCVDGGEGECLDSELLLYCYEGMTRVVDCTLQGDTCESGFMGLDACW